MLTFQFFKRLILISLFYCLSNTQGVFAQNTAPVTVNGTSTGNQTPSITTGNGQPGSPASGGTPAAAAGAPPAQIITQPDGTQITLQTYYCPNLSDLIKNGLYWGTATGGWKSYSESFDSGISSFVGAQWVGVNVGKMICIYKGNLSMSFPVTVQNDSLAQTPTGGLWGNDLGGYRNCHSTNPQDCPFVVKTQSVNINQIYKSLDFFKGKPNPLNQNN